jgi:NADH-quinone oxidoreductase subunit C
LTLSPQQIAGRLTATFGDEIVACLPDDKHPRVHLHAGSWRAVAEFLAGQEDLAFDFLACVSALDYVADNKLCAVYELYATQHRHWFAVKVYTERDNPCIPSVMDIWPAADWHEREAYDLMGIVFEGHADLRRILLPEDWVGHPLRKDYEFPREYHGIPGSTEIQWHQKPGYPT